MQIQSSKLDYKLSLVKIRLPRLYSSSIHYNDRFSQICIKISSVQTFIVRKMDIYGYSSLAVCGWYVCLWSQ